MFAFGNAPLRRLLVVFPRVRDGGPIVRNVLLISNYNTDLRPYNGVCYEFLNTVAGMEKATILAPGAYRHAVPLLDRIGAAQRYHEAIASALHVLHARRHGPLMQRAEVEGEYDLCLFMCQFLRDIPAVERIRGWRERSRFAAAFLLEGWTSEFARSRDSLRLLDRFDHVFVLNASAIPEMRRYTSTPISFLPTAADCIAASPVPEAPARVVDILSLGRRLPAVHEALGAFAEQNGLYYAYDIWCDMRAMDWDEVRKSNAALIKRSRYFVAWAPCQLNEMKRSVIGPDHALSTRYFEAAAGGAVILGSRPACPEFDTLFDWPDAVVGLAPDGRDAAEHLDAFEADPGRWAAASRANVVNALRRHDWSYRWDSILAAAGLERTPGHEGRVAELDRRARAIEFKGSPRAKLNVVEA
jgi:hypothetical protein